MYGVEKAVATIGAFIVGVFLALGIDVSGLVEVIGAAVLTLTPVVVYAVRNGNIDTVGYNKAVVALSAAAVGIGVFFGVDVSGTVEDLASVAMLALPILTWAVPSAFTEA